MTQTSAFSFALGVATQSKKGDILEVYFPQPLLNPSENLLQTFTQTCGAELINSAVRLEEEQLEAFANELDNDENQVDLAQLARTLRRSEQPVIACLLIKDEAPESVAEVYLKLQLLSHRLVKPHTVDLSGMFALLPNLAWTNEGAIALDELPERQLEARMQGKLLEVMSVDKFPKMTNYVVPAGIRIGDTDRVRLGAHLGEGTTVMHEGFVNFNAGTAGTSMIEGRISAGVMVGNGSDLGGGCSTMGTLSGGNNRIISVGEECLIGANAGIGIPLGDRCTVEAGLYITAGSKVAILDDTNNLVDTRKAADLAGQSDLLFRRNSQNGRIECKTNKTAIALNEALHANN